MYSNYLLVKLHKIELLKSLGARSFSLFFARLCSLYLTSRSCPSFSYACVLESPEQLVQVFLSLAFQ